MAHEPDPWLERTGDSVRVCSRGELSDAATEPPFTIEVPLVDFRLALAGLQHDLRGFLGLLHRWAERYAPAEADALTERFA